jgi:hypothetical protein
MTAILAVGGGPGFVFIALAGASGEMEYLSLQWEAYRWAVVIWKIVEVGNGGE